MGVPSVAAADAALAHALGGVVTDLHGVSPVSGSRNEI
jgi:hypothetical protein